ncbi:hypothetical protein WN944_013167 [Citrus x changshan-huyou]|uniref:Snakin-2-like n=1 Tax=Citrus x changshan-huyou TaxID=2935761 RepID=A0AAP0M4I5_9ROSI
MAVRVLLLLGILLFCVAVAEVSSTLKKEDDRDGVQHAGVGQAYTYLTFFELQFQLLNILKSCCERCNQKAYARHRWVKVSIFCFQFARNKNCGGLCKQRCSLHSRPNLCNRACGTCCVRCKCVPPGTAGNRELCGSCYTDMTTHGNRTKCP